MSMVVGQLKVSGICVFVCIDETVTDTFLGFASRVFEQTVERAEANMTHQHLITLKKKKKK